MKDYLFHAVSRLDTEKSLNKIFDTEYILTRDSLKISLTPYEYKNICLNHGANWNGMNSVSISCHPDNYDIVKKYNLKEDDFDNAYSSFIIGSTVLVLNPALLDEFDIKKSSCKMNYEL